ncbi:MAG: glucosidase [Bacteroidetes bacterium]|nr:MAG: glucosidase [Bacteroidota bacterium]
MNTSEQIRIEEANSGRKPWRNWGPYLSDRQWGTVREDYSADGNAWAYAPHDHARSKAWRWGEEGIGGISDEGQRLCFAPAFWNGKDPILKERIFGLAGPEGNHGEDVKEYYYYLDNTPSHAWMQMLYKYPQAPFPYEQLVRESRKRSKLDPEYELIDTGVFEEGRYFDIFIEYAKADAGDILIRIRIENRGADAAKLWVLPTLWFRNTWSWGTDSYKPEISQTPEGISLVHRELPEMFLYADGNPEWAFCENETNTLRLYGQPMSGSAKDGINNWLIGGENSLNPEARGTKASAVYPLTIAGNGSATLRLRLCEGALQAPFGNFDAVMARRKQEADDFYARIQTHVSGTDERMVHRQALAGMLWSKQYYFYDISQWLSGDPAFPPPPASRKQGRNHGWQHLNNADIISMPDKWEYPWYAAWDLAFHCLPLALVDAHFAKQQLLLLTREWYMHPNGQLPAYEWNFSDVNPPVHAWAAWKVYWIDKRRNGKGDRAFLEEIFQKMLLNFTWWVNRKDHEGNNVFEGGFLGLDNIGVFDRSSPLPTGGRLEQADATSWMAMYSLNMMRTALELAMENPVYQSLATKFFEHFLYIAASMANVGGAGISLWDPQDKFFYDVLNLPDNQKIPLRIQSLVGLIPLFAVEVLDDEILKANPEFTRRMEWFLSYRPDLASLVSRWKEMGKHDTHLLSLLRGHRMKALLSRMLDESSFLSEFGIRSLSKVHEKKPYAFYVGDTPFRVAYRPAESDSHMFGGNSNWRGPIWFPVNYLLIGSLRRFYRYYGDDFLVEYPTGSGRSYTLAEIADELSRRLTRIFLRDDKGQRPVYGEHPVFQQDPWFRDYLLFYEYFHGDNGRGAGASHQTGWTGLVANLLDRAD